MPNVLVTGADGFVGRALCEEMVSRGWKVRASVRSRGKIKNFPEEIEIIETGSIGPDTNWTNALNDVEAVVHLAGRVHVMKDSSSNPLFEYSIVNTAGTECLAKAAAGKGVRRFVFLSTVKVNGEGRASAYNEKDIPAPSDPYGISKREAEKQLKFVAGQTGMEVVIIRAPMVYGPGAKANFLKLMKAVYIGVPLPVAGVKNKRSMIYLGNLVDIIMTCLTHPEAGQKTYLVSDGYDVSTPELIRQIAKALGKPARLFHLPFIMLRFAGAITGNLQAIERLTGSLAVDSSKIRKELGWKPTFTMAQGLKQTAEWYKRQVRVDG